MEVDTESVKLSLSNELIKAAHSQSMEAHKDDQQQYITYPKKHTIASSSSMEVVIFAFFGAWEVDDWWHDDDFGETDVDHRLFPSLQRIGEGRLAKVNRSFLQRFQQLLKNSSFKNEVEKVVMEGGKKILLTGHSSGGAIASLATLWVLDQYARIRGTKVPIGCVTFGSPLVGDDNLAHAVRREKWGGHFTHFVMEHDLLPRLMLAPKISIQKHLPALLKSFQQKLNPINRKSHKFLKMFNRTTPERSIPHHHHWLEADEAVALFENLMVHSSLVARHAAFNLMEPTTSLIEKLSVEFVKVSPYRPFGTHVFCTRDQTQTPRQQLVVENPNAVLQLLFYFLQLPCEGQDLASFALNSLAESFGYEEELKKNGMQLQNLVRLNCHLLTHNGDAVRTRSKALFEMSAEAKWCLVAAEEAEKRKKENEKQIDTSMRKYKSNQGSRSKQKIIEDILDEIREYKNQHIDYFDAFKLQEMEEDFVANVNRLELATIWDVVVEMLMRKDLPDEFEVRKEWVDLATEFRRLVEPLDIANYYRHAKGDGYMKVRPKRYKFTQRWYEHANWTGFKSISESSFVAEVEELKKEVEEGGKKTIEEVREGVESIQKHVLEWKSDEKIAERDVFWGESILTRLVEKVAI